jgi:hypothetical protein
LEVEVNDTEDSGFQVRNYFASINENEVSKVTEIQINGRVIRIVDKFTSSEYTPHINSTIKTTNVEITH